MTYLDRFLSVYELPLCSLERVERKCMACLSLAAKLEEANVQSIVSLLFEAGEPGFWFDGKTIQRMEILILNRLNWKIKAYTPCSWSLIGRKHNRRSQFIDQMFIYVHTLILEIQGI